MNKCFMWWSLATLFTYALLLACPTATAPLWVIVLVAVGAVGLVAYIVAAVIDIVMRARPLLVVLALVLLSACGNGAPAKPDAAATPSTSTVHPGVSTTDDGRAARAVAAALALAQDLAAHRPPAGLCDVEERGVYLARSWASDEAEYGAFHGIEGSPEVTIDESIQVDLIGRFCVRHTLRVVLRNADPPCVLHFDATPETIGTHRSNGGDP
jgi:hypothetical protein